MAKDEKTSSKVAGFGWTAKKAACALMLAEGYTKAQVAEDLKVGERTIYTWQTAAEFKEEVDKLSLMVGIASRAGRLRIAHRAIRQHIGDDQVSTEKDILDWLKFAQSETDGIKLGLSPALAETVASLAGRGSGRTDESD